MWGDRISLPQASKGREGGQACHGSGRVKFGRAQLRPNPILSSGRKQDPLSTGEANVHELSQLSKDVQEKQQQSQIPMKLIEDREISTNLGGDLKILNRDGNNLNRDGKYQLYQVKLDFGWGDLLSSGFECAYPSLTTAVIRLAISRVNSGHVSRVAWVCGQP